MKSTSLTFDAKASVRSIDDNGYLHVALTPISKAVVNPYLGKEIPGWQEQGLDAETIYYGLRDPKELAKAAPSFNGLPLLMDHHEFDAENPDKENTVGSTGTDAVFEAPYLKNSLSVTDAEAIKAIEDGTAKEISCAYRYTPDFTAGEYEIDGESVHYDFVMREISGNHVALVAEGRAGHDVAVADHLPPQIKLKKREEQKNMNKRQQKMLAFKRRRYGLAKDANLAIEAAEVMSAGFQKAVNVIEAQVEGYDPRDVGLDIDATATIDEIIDKFIPGLGDEAKETYRGVLTKLKGEGATDEGAANDEDVPPANDEGEETPPPANDKESEKAEDDDPEDERFKDPAFKAGFEAGVKYGEEREKTDPKKLDSEHESEGMKKVLGADSIAKIKAAAKKEVVTSMRALNSAAAKVRPLVGTINDPLAFDSAESIYAFALRTAGKDPAMYPKEAYAGMVDMLLGVTASKPMANDSSRKLFDEKTEEAFARLDKILM